MIVLFFHTHVHTVVPLSGCSYLYSEMSLSNFSVVCFDIHCPLCCLCWQYCVLMCLAFLLLVVKFWYDIEKDLFIIFITILSSNINTIAVILLIWLSKNCIYNLIESSTIKAIHV